MSLQAPSVLQVSTAPGGLQVPKGQGISVCVGIRRRQALELHQEVQPVSLFTSLMWVLFYWVYFVQAQLKRRAIVVSNKLDCITPVDSNVEFNLVVPEGADWNVDPG